jgi:hypothetical protein
MNIFSLPLPATKNLKKTGQANTTGRNEHDIKR